MLTKPKIAIIYLSFHCEPYIDDVVSSLKNITYPKDRLALVIPDNPHPQYGLSMRYLEEHVLPLSKNELPEVVLLPQKENLGFAGGNNVGIKWALDNGFDYILFHNNDGFFASQALEPLVEAMENDKSIGIAQPLILLYPDKDLINTSGNCFHYLGLAFCNNLRVKKDSITFKPVEEICFASGAAPMMRADLLREYGLWDEDYFLYHEDLEYTFRLKSAGYKSVLVSNSIFYHKYSFSRNKGKFYYIERNRYGLMLSFFKWPTLLLLAPMAVVLDLGLLLFALKSGWIKEKLSAYKYWLKGASWRLWLSKRKKIQSIRKVKDKEILKMAVGKVVFDDKNIDNPLLRYIGNPIMNVYWQIVKRIIFW